MTEKIEIDGLAEMLKDIAEMGKKATSDQTLDALEAGGNVLVSYAQDNASNKLNKHPTGNLTNSFAVKREGNSVLAGVFGVVYAKIHEFGGVIKRDKLHVAGEQWSVTIPARPYMRPAIDDNNKEIGQAIIDALTGLIFGGG